MAEGSRDEILVDFQVELVHYSVYFSLSKSDHIYSYYIFNY